MCDCSVSVSPAIIALTRTFGAHSTAREPVRFTRPAFAAPYAAVPGEGLSVLR